MKPNGKAWIKYEDRYRLRVFGAGVAIVLGLLLLFFVALELVSLVFPPQACT